MDNPQASTFTTEDLAWLGGLIDGEGCISLCKRNRTPTSTNYYPEIIISNTDNAIIEEAARIMEGFKIGHWVLWRSASGRALTKRLMGHVDISGYKRCQKALEILTPYVRAKRDQAELLKSFIERRFATCYRKQTGYTEQDVADYEKLQQLKRKPAPETIHGGYRYYDNKI